MAGKFGHVKVRRSEMLPHGELAKLMGYTGPDDVLVITVAEGDDPISSPPTTKASDSASKHDASTFRRLSDVPVEPQATPAAQGRPSDSRSARLLTLADEGLREDQRLALMHERLVQRRDLEADTAAPAIEDHGYTLGAATKLAASYDMTLAEAGGLYTLESAFGTQPYTTLADAVACIKQYGRWREAVRQTIDTQTRRLR